METIANIDDGVLILFEIWIFQFGIYLRFGICNLLFAVYLA